MSQRQIMKMQEVATINAFLNLSVMMFAGSVFSFLSTIA